MKRKTISLNLTVADLERFDNVSRSQNLPFPLSRTETLLLLLAMWEKENPPLTTERSDNEL